MISVVVISDIHFGALPAVRLYAELKSEFLDFIKNKYIDMIVIAGDFYNSILTLNSSSTITSFNFIKELLTICSENDIKYLRIIEGTLSHDNFQIMNLKDIERHNVDFRIIPSTQTEVIDGMNILYLPEEYGKEVLDYKEFLDVPKKFYDFIFGHGMFEETSFTKDKSQVTSMIWDSKLLCSICRGPIVFGHIHTPQIIRKHIYYTGSFSRWVYGQEEDKGFMLFIYDKNTGKYISDFIVNKLATKYDTLAIYLDRDNITPDNIIALANAHKIDNLRVTLILENPDIDNTFTLSVLKEYYTGKKGYTLQVIDKRDKLIREEKEREIDSLNTEFNFLFDKALPMKTKIYKFIKKKYGRDVSEDIIASLLSL